ncbi:hypothetical protein GF406_03685 [candidate division KSB1 bacterium]|nr:hypothetical protein [candidate division KSB1 bacterium]
MNKLWTITNVLLFVFGTAFSQFIVKSPSGSNLMMVREDGFVAIGQTEPAAYLHIQPSENPTEGAPLFIVQSAGKTERFRVEHLGRVYIEDSLWVNGTATVTQIPSVQQKQGKVIISDAEGHFFGITGNTEGQILKWKTSDTMLAGGAWTLAQDETGSGGTADGVVTNATVSGGSTKMVTLERSIGTDVTFDFSVNDADHSTSNELQTLSIGGPDDNELFISNGNSVILPGSSDNQQLSISGHTLSLDRGGSVTLPDNVNDADNIVGNEYPQAGTMITVSGRQVNHDDTSDQSSVNNSGRTVIQDVTLDSRGHITGLNSTTLVDAVNDADADPSNELQDLNLVLGQGDNANSQNINNLNRLGVGVSSPNSRIQVLNIGTSVTLKGITNANVTHRFGTYSENRINNQTSKGIYAVMGSTFSPNTTTGGYFSGGVAGRAYDTVGSDILAQGELGKTQTTNTGRWVSGTMGNINADNTASFVGGTGSGAAVRAYVYGNNENHARIWAGYFEGAKSYFSHTVTMPGADYAEMFVKEGDPLPGDLIGINTATGKARTYQEGDVFIGVYSENPAIAGNFDIQTEVEETHIPVALFGQVNVNSEQTLVENGVVYTTDNIEVGTQLSNGKILIGFSSRQQAK